MAAKLLNLTDPHTPKWYKWSDIRLCESRIEWLVPNKTFRFKQEAIPAAELHHPVCKPSQAVISIKIEPNIDRRLGVKFVDPAARAMLKTPQLNRIWMGEKAWLWCD